MIKAIVTDIEGTTTSVSFVYEVLFPYFVNNLAKLNPLLALNETVRTCFENIKKIVQEEDNIALTDKGVIEKLVEWVSNDRKETNLKKLQGILWAQAYQSGEIKGHLYEDVVPCLRKWQEQGITLAVYSSGSVTAQKLLFGYSDCGDVTAYFSAYFDTTIGHKREVASYQNIAQALALPAEQILFLSDVEQELDAAQAAAFQTVQLVRPGTQASEKHKTVVGFDEIKV